MTDNEIIKALECCIEHGTCTQKKCHFRKECEKDLMAVEKYALDTINRQKAEKEALIAGQETLQKYIAEQKAEIERLSDRNHKCVYLSDDETTEFCVDGPCPEHKTVGEIKAEAIKYFAERLKEYVGDDLYFEIETNAFLILIDKLIYEMVGDGNENLQILR